MAPPQGSNDATSELGRDRHARTFFAAGVVFIFLDLATGSCWYLTPEQVDRNLDPLVAQTPDEGDVKIRVVLEPEPGWKLLGKLEPAG
jgi:hypothetical protein